MGICISLPLEGKVPGEAGRMRWKGMKHLISQPCGCQLPLKGKPWDVREAVPYKNT